MFFKRRAFSGKTQFAREPVYGREHVPMSEEDSSLSDNEVFPIKYHDLLIPPRKTVLLVLPLKGRGMGLLHASDTAN